MAIKGTRGDDIRDGTDGDDIFNLRQGGSDSANGGDGNDLFRMGAALDAGDRIDGGNDNDMVWLRGDYSAGLVFDDATITNVERLRVDGNFVYNLTLADGNVAGAERLTVNAGSIGAGGKLIFDGSAETDGHYTIYASQGDDAITGGGLGDRIFLGNGGNDTVHAGGGNDIVFAGGSFTAADAIDGGSGHDTLELNLVADLTATFGAATLTNVENLVVEGGHSVNLTLDDATVGAGATLRIDASGSSLVTIDALAETDGYLDVIGSAGATDYVAIGSEAVLAGSHIDGGAGTSDALYITGDFSDGFTFSDDTMKNIESLRLGGGHSYDLTIGDANVGNLGLSVDPGALGKTDKLIFDGSAVTHGGIQFFTGAGADTLIGSAVHDLFWLSGGGNDTVEGGGGADTFTQIQLGARLTFVYEAVSDSTGKNFDTLWTNGDDFFKISSFATLPTAYDPDVLGGTLSVQNFDSDLEAAIGADQLGAHHVVLFKPNFFTYSGHAFMIVDVNGIAGYQAQQDLVIEVTNSLALPDIAHFI
jgi:hypothetical protein